MNLVTKAALLVLCMAAPLGAAAGQSAAHNKPLPDYKSTPTAEKSKPIEPSLQKILLVLDQLIEAQSSFQDTDVRTAIRAQVADMLWSHDEARARRLFEEAFLAMVNGPVRERSIWSAPAGPDSQHPVRNAVISAIVRRDPALAAKMAENIDDDFPPEKDPKVTPGAYHRHSELSTIRSQLATLLARTHPLLAAQVGKAFAERGDIMRLHGLLGQIRKKEPKVAEELFLLALERAKLGKPSLNEIRWFGAYLFPYFEEGMIVNLPERERNEPYLPIASSPQAIPKFLELAYEVVRQRVAALSTVDGADSNAHHPILKFLAPYFDRFMPDKAVSFRALVEQARRSAPPEEQSDSPGDASAQVQGLLARADKLVESRPKDVLYNRAAVLAETGLNFDQSAAIIERITDEKIRAVTRFSWRLSLHRHKSEQLWRALAKADFGKAETVIAGTSDSDLRLGMLVRMLEGLVHKDRARALQLLDEAERRTFSLEDGVKKARQLVLLAGAGARIDADRGFEAMKRAVVEFNRADFVPEWERYRAGQSNSEADKDPILTNIGLSALLDNREFEGLGSRDLNRALAVAQEIRMKEASALAQLAVCRGSLSKLQAAASRQK